MVDDFDAFCQEGRNKGKPGPCPEGGRVPAAQGLSRVAQVPEGAPNTPANQLRREIHAMPLAPHQTAAVNHLVGVGVEALKAMPEVTRLRHTQAMCQVAAKLPPAACERVAANVNKVVPVKDSRGTTREYERRVRASGLEPEAVSVGGFYDHKDGHLWVDGDEASAVVGRSHVWAHELGHAIDGPDFALSRSKEWQTAYEAEVRGGDLSPYARISPKEGFAELCRAVYAPGILDHKSAEMEAKFPLSLAFLRERGLL